MGMFNPYSLLHGSLSGSLADDVAGIVRIDNLDCAALVTHSVLNLDFDCSLGTNLFLKLDEAYFESRSLVDELSE